MQVLLRHSGDSTHNLDREWYSNLPVRVSQSRSTIGEKIDPIEISDGNSDSDDGDVSAPSKLPALSVNQYVFHRYRSVPRPFDSRHGLQLALPCRPIIWDSLETMKQRIPRSKQARLDLECHRESKLTDNKSSNSVPKRRTENMDDVLNDYALDDSSAHVESQTWRRANFPSNTALLGAASSSEFATEARGSNYDTESAQAPNGGSRAQSFPAGGGSAVESISASSFTAFSESGRSTDGSGAAQKVRPRALGESGAVASSGGRSTDGSGAAQKVRPRALGESGAVASSGGGRSTDGSGTAQKVRPRALGENGGLEGATGRNTKAITSTASAVLTIAPKRSTAQLSSPLALVNRSPTFLTKAPSWSAFQSTADERRSTAVEAPAQQKRRSILLASSTLRDSDRQANVLFP